jgi:putrescine transport system permease protein
MRASRGRFLVIGLPFLWLAVFFLAPFLIILGISFSVADIGAPPYAPIFEFAADHLGGLIPRVTLRLDNYAFLLTDDLYLFAYLNSLKIAAVSTIFCLLIGYPMAYAIAQAAPRRRPVLMMLVVMPFWTSFLIRIYAWMGILKSNGVLNTVLLWAGVIDAPLELINTPFAVHLGIVYAYLPFMILPLYATLEKLDPALLEAAADLGCKPFRAFLAITLPLSLPGVLAGSLLVFIPAVGEFVIPELLGGPDTLMIGSVLWNEFFNNRDWPLASSVAVAMLLFLVVPIMLFQRQQGDGASHGRGVA